ncbi:MAG: glycosyltransferase family 2 protein [Actinomycetota bacterium]
MMHLVAIVPARNESERISATVLALRTFCDEVIVVDDGSVDETSTRARDAGARIVRLDRSRGKGSALRAGLRSAHEADLLLFADADLGDSAIALKELVGPVVAGSADLAIAAPPKGAPSGLGIVESFSRVGIKALTGRRVSRPLSGQRAMRFEVAQHLVIPNGFAVETAMTIDALRDGWNVIEIEIEFSHARTGRTLSGFAHRARQGGAVISALARRSLHKRPQRGKVQT